MLMFSIPFSSDKFLGSILKMENTNLRASNNWKLYFADVKFSN